jgi:penicillin-binding protein 2
MKQKIILTIIFLLYSLVIIKVTSLSVINHKLYTDLANSNIHKKIYIKPIRGIIYDTNNNPIAYNELRFSLLLKPHLKNSELNDTVAFINKYINIDTKKIIKTYKKQNSW